MGFNGIISNFDLITNDIFNIFINSNSNEIIEKSISEKLFEYMQNKDNFNILFNKYFTSDEINEYDLYSLFINYVFTVSYLVNKYYNSLLNIHDFSINDDEYDNSDYDFVNEYDEEYEDECEYYDEEVENKEISNNLCEYICNQRNKSENVINIYENQEDYNLIDVFSDFDLGTFMLDDYLEYLSMSLFERKTLTYSIDKKVFQKLNSENNVFSNLYKNLLNLKISEEEKIINYVKSIYDYYDINDKKCQDDIFNIYTFNESNIKTNYKLNKIKRTMIAISLIDYINNNFNNSHIKHLFSVILNNVFSEIFYSKNNDGREIYQNDFNFYDMIISNRFSFDELFNMFINNTEFSNYLIGTFYFINLDNKVNSLDDRNKFFIDENMEEKIKKYKK